MFRATISPILRSTRLCSRLVVQCTDDAAAHTASVQAPHNLNQCRTPYAVIHSLVLLMMGIMMPETCSDTSSIINIRLVCILLVYLSSPHILLGLYISQNLFFRQPKIFSFSKVRLGHHSLQDPYYFQYGRTLECGSDHITLGRVECSIVPLQTSQLPHWSCPI